MNHSVLEFDGEKDIQQDIENQKLKVLPNKLYDDLSCKKY